MNLNKIPQIEKIGTILMFSGGRDSTLAAVRLNKISIPMMLVTITSTHLEGIERVHIRLKELARLLPLTTPWIHIEQPVELQTDMSFYDQTCLPCHHAYVVVSVAIAKIINASQLAFGYTEYQNDWPEQTPFAVSRLAETLRRNDIELLLPVNDISSKEQAIEELKHNNLSVESLEQKCFQQVINVALSKERLIQQVELWENAIEQSMSAISEIPISVIDCKTLEDFIS